jgi:magnesium transporter
MGRRGLHDQAQQLVGRGGKVSYNRGMTNVPALDRPVTEFLSPAAFTLREDLTIDQALAALRAGARDVQKNSGSGGNGGAGKGPAPVAYLYVVNEREELVGVMPMRRMIMAPGETRIGDLMTREAIALGERETLFDALELFAMHRFLALPVVDAQRRLRGVVELALYTDEAFDLAQTRQLNEVFQLIGLHLERHKQGGAWAGFRMRMPWLLANIGGGLICAALGAMFQATLAKTVLLALFIPLILTLAESVAVQSMTLAIERAVLKRKFPGELAREMVTAILLGVCAGALVGAVSLLWRGPWMATVAIGTSVAGAMFCAAMLGRAVPGVIHAMKLNPRIASGPMTLAVVDVVTVGLYLSGATWMLGG